MPPKAEITVVKFKRARSTYVISLILNQKKNLTVDHFIASLVEAINSSGGIRLVELTGSNDGIQVTHEDIELAFPKTKDSPYSNEWIPILDDAAIELTVLNDYDVIGFKYVADSDIMIEEPIYEEDAA